MWREGGGSTALWHALPRVCQDRRGEGRCLPTPLEAATRRETYRRATMSRGPTIRRVSVYQYRVETHDLGVDYNGFNSVYEPGAQREGVAYLITIENDQG